MWDEFEGGSGILRRWRWGYILGDKNSLSKGIEVGKDGFF